MFEAENLSPLPDREVGVLPGTSMSCVVKNISRQANMLCTEMCMTEC